MLRLYLDENAMSAALVPALLSGGIDVVTAAQEGMLRQPDFAQLQAATERERALYTFDAGGFARLHREWLSRGAHHAGIIIINDQRMPVGEQARRLLKVPASLTMEEFADRIGYLGAWQ